MGWIKRLLQKENPAMRAVFGTIVPGQPVWSPKNYEALSKAGYQNVASVFGCVTLIAKTASRLSWVELDQKGNEVDDSRLLDLLKRPNEAESGITFTEKVFSYLLLSGNSEIIKVHGLDSQPPRFLYAVRPDRMRPIPGTWQNPIAGWEYTAGMNKVLFKGTDVMHLKEFNPTNDWYGLSRLEVAQRHIDISNGATAWNAKLLQNDMRPAGVLNFKEALNEDEREDIRKQVEYRSTGFDNAGRFLITEGEAEWTQMSINPKDVDWLNGQKFTLRQICSIFGIPSELLGDSENKTYSNYQEARKALYEETVLPLMDIYTAELNNWLVPLFAKGHELTYDRDAIEALQEEREKKYSYLKGADWLTVNEKRVATGYDEITEGDVILVPISNIPLAQQLEETEPPPDIGGDQTQGEGQNAPLDQGDEGKPVPDEEVIGGEKARPGASQPQNRPKTRAIKAVKKSFWTEHGRRARLWTAFDIRTKARGKSFNSLALRYMIEQADHLKAKAMTFPTVANVNVDLMLNVKEEAKKYEQRFLPWYVDHALRAGEAGMASTKGEIFLDATVKGLLTKKDKPRKWTFDLTPAREEELIRMVFYSGTKVNETLIDIVYDVLHASMRDNATIKQFAEQIWEQVDSFSPARARLWAETESTKVDNWGMLEGFKQDGSVEFKGWNCQLLETSRDPHIEADGQEQRLEDPFNVGREALMFPGDPAGSAWNVCNCRCSQYPVLESSWGAGE